MLLDLVRVAVLAAVLRELVVSGRPQPKDEMLPKGPRRSISAEKSNLHDFYGAIPGHKELCLFCMAFTAIRCGMS